MDDRSLKALEFYQLLEILKELSISPLGRKRCEALRPYNDLTLIQLRLTHVLELKEILETKGDIPLRGLKDIEGILKKLEVEGSVLDIQELLEIYQQMSLVKELSRFFLKLETVKASHLQEKVSQLSSLKGLEKEILQAINKKGEILDRASPVLSEIRGQLGKIRERAKGMLEHLLHQEELQPIFQEHFITLRNGRYVLLIKSDYKNRLEGIIHDQSQSRMTFFFEPLQVVALNNEINILMGEEKEEEFRILGELSEKARGEKESLWRDFEILGEFDLLYAMAKLSVLLKSVRPVLNEEGKIEMRKARNPLLMLQTEGEVVPVDLRMGDGIKVLILSGANAGGKTVALKTIGLLTLMAQSGLPIPAAEGSQGAIFQDIFAVIGDEQDMRENLSTFSSHLLHVNQILGKAGARSLVLLDELGVGTHASEGCALAMGFLDQFRESKASVVVTTHFDRLKIYGYLHNDVENVAVDFDKETLEPQYTLSYGSSGLSNAFLVAEKLGISEEVLKKANYHREGGEMELSRALETLERIKADTEKERSQLLRVKEETGQERQRLNELLERIKKKRQEIFLQAEEKARKAVQNVEEEIKEWIRHRKVEKTPLNLPRQSVYRKEIEEIKERFLPPVSKRRPSFTSGGLKVGERVRIDSLQSNGILTKLEAPLKRAEVVTDKARVKAPLSEIITVNEEEKGQGVEIQKGKFMLPQRHVPEPPSQLNVIGLTVEDALPKVDKFIDQALLHGLEKVHIIHGIGSGRLRSAVGNFLRGHRGVKSFELGEMRGGAGVTVVELR